MEAGTPARPIIDNVDKAMLAWFASPSTTPLGSRRPFGETDLRGISDVLRRTGRESWSRVPRIYATLRLINQLPAIEDFLTQGLSDMWFPFSHKTLPASLKSQAARCDFLEAQRLVLTKALDLEKEDGKHRHFSNPAEIPFQKIAELGKGGFSYVDRVLSTVSYKEYARKLIPRGRTFRKDQDVLRDFERELATLKKLSHMHIVELVGSYTDPRFVGIIMSPVADYNLKEFLELDPLPPGSKSFLETFFGCLAAALKYLHENRIRHKDIKPQNVLVKGHQVLLTDFGISRDWSELGHSTTTGFTTMTPRYSAPEVAAHEPRNSSADIWSLGCVFLEIWTVLCGETTSNLTEHMKSVDSCSHFYYQNLYGITSWCDKIDSTRNLGLLEHPYRWILTMLEPRPQDRCNAQGLLDWIQEVNADPETPITFTGLCCVEDEHSAESVQSSIFEHDVTETTNVSSTAIPPGRSTSDLLSLSTTQPITSSDAASILQAEPKSNTATPEQDARDEFARTPPATDTLQSGRKPRSIHELAKANEGGRRSASDITDPSPDELPTGAAKKEQQEESSWSQEEELFPSKSRVQAIVSPTTVKTVPRRGVPAQDASEPQAPQALQPTGEDKAHLASSDFEHPRPLQQTIAEGRHANGLESAILAQSNVSGEDHDERSDASRTSSKNARENMPKASPRGIKLTETKEWLDWARSLPQNKNLDEEGAESVATGHNVQGNVRKTSTSDMAREASQFAHILLKLRFACETCEDSIPQILFSLKHTKNIMLRPPTADFGKLEVMADLMEKSEKMQTMATDLASRLLHIHQEKYTRSQPDFWQQCLEFSKAWWDLVLTVATQGRKRGLVSDELKLLMKPPHKSIKAASKAIVDSPWSHFVVGNLGEAWLESIRSAELTRNNSVKDSKPEAKGESHRLHYTGDDWGTWSSSDLSDFDRDSDVSMMLPVPPSPIERNPSRISGQNAQISESPVGSLERWKPHNTYESSETESDPFIEPPKPLMAIYKKSHSFAKVRQAAQEASEMAEQSLSPQQSTVPDKPEMRTKGRLAIQTSPVASELGASELTRDSILSAHTDVREHTSMPSERPRSKRKGGKGEEGDAVKLGPDDAQLPPIILKDDVGNKFPVPWQVGKTRQGIEDFINQSFSYENGPPLQTEDYYLFSPTGEIAKPGSQIEMRMRTAGTAFLFYNPIPGPATSISSPPYFHARGMDDMRHKSTKQAPPVNGAQNLLPPTRKGSTEPRRTNEDKPKGSRFGSELVRLAADLAVLSPGLQVSPYHTSDKTSQGPSPRPPLSSSVGELETPNSTREVELRRKYSATFPQHNTPIQATSASSRPLKLTRQGLPTFSSARSHSPSQSRRPKQKQRAESRDAYDDTRSTERSSGAAKRVMDFFRRRGRQREEERYNPEELFTRLPELPEKSRYV